MRWPTPLPLLNHTIGMPESPLLVRFALMFRVLHYGMHISVVQVLPIIEPRPASGSRDKSSSILATRVLSTQYLLYYMRSRAACRDDIKPVQDDDIKPSQCGVGASVRHPPEKSLGQGSNDRKFIRREAACYSSARYSLQQVSER